MSRLFLEEKDPNVKNGAKFNITTRAKWQKLSKFKIANIVHLFLAILQRNWVFATNSGFLIPFALQPNVV